MRRDEQSPIIDQEDRFGETLATGAGLAAGASIALCRFVAKCSYDCAVSGLGVNLDPAGDGYVTFSLRVNGVKDPIYGKIKSGIARVDQPQKIHRPVGQADVVEIWAENDPAAPASYQCSARVQADYRNLAHVG